MSVISSSAIVPVEVVVMPHSSFPPLLVTSHIIRYVRAVFLQYVNHQISMLIEYILLHNIQPLVVSKAKRRWEKYLKIGNNVSSSGWQLFVDKTFCI